MSGFSHSAFLKFNHIAYSGVRLILINDKRSYHSLYMISFTNVYLSSFQFGAITNSTSVNIPEYIFWEYMYTFLFV